MTQDDGDVVADASRYRAGVTFWARAGEGQFWLSKPGARSAPVVAELDVEILMRCSSFLTFEEHVAAVARALQPRATPERVRQSLESAMAAGLLESEADIRRELTSRAHDEAPPKAIETLVVVTCDRPKLFGRCLRSYAENIRRAGRSVVFLVVDDSKQPQLAEGTRAVVAEVRRELGVSIRYVGRPERARYAGELARACAPSGVDPKLVEFALLGTPEVAISIGANRNASLLATLGQRILTVDDDTVCRPVRPANFCPGIRFCSPDMFRPELVTFESRDETFAWVTFEDCDYVGLHDGLLGWHVWDRTAREEPDNVDIAGANPALIRRLRNSGGRVRVTQVGLYGDLGSSDPLPQIHLSKSGESWKRMIASEAKYAALLASREAFFGLPSVTISDTSPVMAYAAGIDNRELLPPFLPVLRSEDDVFWAVLGKCDKEVLVGYLPRAVGHFPGEDRRFDRGGLPHGSAYACHDLLLAILGLFQSVTGFHDTARIMTRMGGAVRQMGHLSPSDLDDLAWRCYAESSANLVTKYERLLSEHRAEPEHWARDVKALIDGTRRRVSQRPVRYDDLPPDSEATLCGQLIGRYGDLLCAWPEIRARALELNESGRGLGAELP
jgi:hypothetical protein